MKSWMIIMLFVVVLLYACSSSDDALSECKSFLQQSLRDTCYAKLGILRLDLNICDKAGGSKYFCYEGVAEATEAPSVCSEIEDDYWKPVCYMNLALLKNEAALCSKVESQALSDQCYYEIAVNSSNEGACKGIINDNIMTNCFIKIARAKAVVDICFNIGEVPSRDMCIYYVSKSTVNSTTCNLIEDSLIKKSCGEVVGNLKKD